MMFWYVHCLNSVKDGFVASNDHRQWRGPVKQRFLRGSVQDMDESGANAALFVFASAYSGRNRWCLSGSAFVKSRKIWIYIAGLIVLTSTGAKIFTTRKIFLTRATQSTEFRKRRERVKLQK